MPVHAINSADTGEWYSNPTEMEPIRAALGGVIHLDPCGSETSNLAVKALHVLSSEGELAEWCPFGSTGFVNPPGTCKVFEPMGIYWTCGNRLITPKGSKGRCSCGLTKKFLLKSYEEAARGMDIVYMAYNMSQLRQLSRIERSVATSIAIPPNRYKFLKHDTLKPGKGASVDSALIMISEDPQAHHRFSETFNAESYSVWKEAA